MFAEPSRETGKRERINIGMTAIHHLLDVFHPKSAMMYEYLG